MTHKRSLPLGEERDRFIEVRFHWKAYLYYPQQSDGARPARCCFLNALRGLMTAQFRVPSRTADLGGSPERRVSAWFTSKAGERIQTVDIHVGNVCERVTQSIASQQVASFEVDARSKYAARNTLHIKRISTFAVGEWPRDPDHARVV